VNRTRVIAVALTCSILAAACGETTRQQMGTAIGGVGGVAAGALIGKKLGGTTGAVIGGVGGAAVGAVVGYQIAKMLDERDRPQHAAATQKALDTGQPQVWTNPETGNSGKVEVKEATTSQVTSGSTTPAGQPTAATSTASTSPAGTAAVGQCKTVKQTITLKDGTTREEEVKACKGPNGWETVG
jgi:surface antigen